ncbi:MAG: hypothetical protein IJP61_01810 [Treponema sp.]|nr:hypothetical protein [Treponema sp.]
MDKQKLKDKVFLFRAAILIQLLILIPFFLSVALRLFFPQISESGFIRFFLNHKKQFLGLAFLFAASDLCYIKRDFLSAHKIEIGAILGITFLSTLLLFMPGASKGHDLPFHLTRIEGMTDAIKHGQFPVRFQPFWFDGYGYPVSIYYGDLLLYIPVILRLFNVQLGLAYEIYIFLITAFTATLAFISFKRIFSSMTIGLLSSLVYTTSTYRLVDVFTRSAVGEYTAFVFFPIIALAMFKIYSEESRGHIFKNSLLFSLGMSGLLLNHLLSTELAAIALFITCLVLWKKTFTKAVILSILLSALMTLLFSASFIVPFLDYYKNVPVVVQNLGPRAIQHTGVYIIQLFTFFQPSVGINPVDVSRRMPYTPGLLLMSALILSVAFIVYVRKDKMLALFIFLSAAIFFMSSTFFPYNAICFTKIGNILTQIQFPFRWIAIMIVFLTLAFGRLFALSTAEFPKIKNAACIAVIFLSFVQGTFFASSFLKDSQNHFIKDYKEFGTTPSHGNEYARFKSDIGKRDRKISANSIAVLDEKRDGNSFDVKIQSENGGFIEFPVFNYKGYKAFKEDGSSLEVSDGTNNVVRVTVKEPYNGTIKLRFVPPFYWHISEIITLTSLVCALAFFFKIEKKKSKPTA